MVKNREIFKKNPNNRYRNLSEEEKKQKKRNKHQKNRYKSVKKNNKSNEYQVVKY